MVRLSERVGRIRAPNPSPMTLTGTNTYVVNAGESQAIVIDPGPPLAEHVAAISETLAEGGLRVAAILVTHGHPDHAPAAEMLAARTGAPVWAHSYAHFPTHRALGDRELLRFSNATFEVIDAPGHTFDHLVFWLKEERALFTGDVMLGDESTTVIAPPGGAMRPYQRTLRRLLDYYGDAAAIYGGHGEPIAEPRRRLEFYIAHRQNREREVLARLERGAATIPDLVEEIYARYDRRIWPAAARQLLAHLLALEEENRVVPRLVARNATESERAILDPNLGKIADRASAEVLRAELGAALDLPLVEYRLA